MARRPIRPARGPRRQTLWIPFGPTLFTLTAAGQSLLLFSLNAAALALRPFTVVRTRGEFHYRSDQVVASEEYGGVVGMAVVSDQAVAIGITAVPSPVTDMGSDLFYLLESGMGSIDVLSSVGVTELGHIHKFDSKAMRKVDSSEDIVVTAETPANSTSFRIWFSGRMLVKLH